MPHNIFSLLTQIAKLAICQARFFCKRAEFTRSRYNRTLQGINWSTYSKKWTPSRDNCICEGRPTFVDLTRSIHCFLCRRLAVSCSYNRRSRPYSVQTRERLFTTTAVRSRSRLPSVTCCQCGVDTVPDSADNTVYACRPVCLESISTLAVCTLSVGRC